MRGLIFLVLCCCSYIVYLICIVGAGYFFRSDIRGMLPIFKPAGSPCSSDIQCSNGACGRPAAGTDKLICCQSGQIDTYAFNDYCTGMPNGTPCWSDAMCASGDCKGNLGGLRKGVCS